MGKTAVWILTYKNLHYVFRLIKIYRIHLFEWKEKQLHHLSFCYYEPDKMPHEFARLMANLGAQNLKPPKGKAKWSMSVFQGYNRCLRQ